MGWFFMRERTLLIVSAGVEAVHGIRRAKELGLRVIVSDRDTSAPGFAYADDGFEASTYDPQATADAAEDYARRCGPISGVITIGADVPLTVATVAARLGLPGISLEAARLAQDKLAMKARLAQQGIPVPAFAAIPNLDALKRHTDTRGLGYVLKPADSRGGRGVQRLSAVKDLAEAWEVAAGHSPSGRVMVEEFLDGPQISTESILIDGLGATPGFSDRNYPYLDRYTPYFIEDGGDLPSSLPVPVQADVKATVEAAGRALGVKTGNIKGDMVVHNGKPYVIEIAARASGGYFCTREIPLNTGVDFIGAVIRIALGERVSLSELSPRFERPVVQRYLFPTPGRVVSVRGSDAASQMPGIEECLVTVKPGSIIRPPTDSNCTAAMVLATGSSRAEAQMRAAQALNLIAVETVPL
ncbi:MAG TPA: phosphoribosylglycinamide synthetase [Alphaproteobacteria bacterium]|nr:phosphoribosylglycinamide synthetase [Alphaproteobacteria bacterium]HAJ47190.1 phosphoribosylglycinamide synthetase [Alphaproteobacteria bacterium]